MLELLDTVPEKIFDLLFNSFEFALFLPLVFILYWFVFNKNLKGQNFFLLFVSYVFYGWWDWRFLGLIAFSSFVDYWAGIQIEKNSEKKKMFLWISLSTNLGLLGVFKYFNFFSVSLSLVFESIGITIDPFTLAVVLPVGISFYTFQTMSYTIDVFRGKLGASKDIVSFFAYVSFFPQLVAGPIERAINLLPQFNRSRTFCYEQGSDGLRLILWGLFKKLVIADNCALFVNQTFQNYQASSGLELILGSVFFAFQIYGDFSGYSDIARGTAKLFGFELMVNFRTPYFSRDVAEFWRRWHISLSTWFRDYLYIPLGGSTGKKWIVIRNTMLVFLISGFWHGANWTFIVWGTLHGAYFLPLLLSKKNRSNLDTASENRVLPTLKEACQMLLTFAMICFGWIFFRAASLNDAVNYIVSIFANEFILQGFDFPFETFFTIIILLTIEWLIRIKGINRIGEFGPLMRSLVYFCIALLIFLFGRFNNQEFIYFQF